MYRSAEKSGILDYMTFVQNGVDEVRRTASMTIDNTNNGGSFVELGQENSEPNANTRKFAWIVLQYKFFYFNYITLAIYIIGFEPK